MIRNWGFLPMELAEIAGGRPSLESFRLQTLNLLQERIGFEFAALQNSSRLPFETLGYSQGGAKFTAACAQHVAEFTNAEIARIVGVGAVTIEEAFDARRQTQLRIFRELLNPLGLRHVVSCVQVTPQALIGLMVGRKSPKIAFSAREKAALEACLPVMSCVEHLAESASPSFHAFGVARGLTERETQVAELVVRGMTNREVATLLRCSQNTIRNRLAAVFKKAGVTSRSELAFEALSERCDRTERLAPFDVFERRVAAVLRRHPRAGDGETLASPASE